MFIGIIYWSRQDANFRSLFYYSWNCQADMVKACIHYFLTNFYFSLNDSPSKTMKDVFISYKKLFSFSRYSNFCISIFPLFLTDSHCLRAWSKTNLKVYDVVNFLNINLIKQPFYARNFLKIRHFERRLSNTFEKVNFPLSFEPSPF